MQNTCTYHLVIYNETMVIRILFVFLGINWEEENIEKRGKTVIQKGNFVCRKCRLNI